jgi:hypothetical protein
MCARAAAPAQRLVIIISLCIGLILAPVRAAESPSAPDPLATLDALLTTPIPPRDRVALALSLGGLDPARLQMPGTAPPLAALGDLETFSVFDLNGGEVRAVPARLVALGEHLALWVEVGAYVEQAVLARLTAAFDAHLYDVVRALWGSEPNPGVDGDPRIHGLFAGEIGGVVAYFSSAHLYPAAVIPGSNAREMLFYNLDAVGPLLSDDAGLRRVESTTAHEFQHLIRAATTAQIDGWLDEGFSTYTQLALGYDDVLGYARAYLDAPGTQLNTWDGGAHYGASLLFTTYLAERCGHAMLRAVAALATGEATADLDRLLRARCEADFVELFADWAAANWLRAPGTRYGYAHPLLATLPGPAVVALAQTYPFALSGQAAQFGAHYIDLDALGEADVLRVELDMPATVGLLADVTPTGTSDGFWYSGRADDSAPILTLHTPVDLANATTARLEYRLWYDIEADWDYGYVQASADSGATWESLATGRTTTRDPHGLAYGPGYSGASGGWVDEAIVLDDYAGQRVALRFMVITDDAVNRAGLALDDLRLTVDDTEVELDGWSASGWVRAVDALPARAVVQLMAWDADGDVVVVRREWPGEFVDGPASFALDPGWDSIALAILPVTPVTTARADYRLRLTLD